MILADWLESGYPQFMASSRAMEREGLSLIWEKGVYRMNFGIMVRLNLGPNTIRRAPECPQPSRVIASKIQNLHVRVKAVVGRDPALWSEVDLDNLGQFAGSRVRRKLCQIDLEIRFDKRACFSDRVLNALKRLKGFERVEVRLVYPPETFSLWVTPSYDERASIQIRNLYVFVGRKLAAGLGRGIVVWNEDGHVMKFKPREAAAAKASAGHVDQEA